MQTQYQLSSLQSCSPFQAPLGTTKIWNLVSWQRDECTHSSGICFKLSIKISTVLGKKISTVLELAGWDKLQKGTDGGGTSLSNCLGSKEQEVKEHSSWVLLFN